MTEMTQDSKERVLFIFAGYVAEMADFRSGEHASFVRAFPHWEIYIVNPGLARRISHTFTFENYSIDELVMIILQKVIGQVCFVCFCEARVTTLTQNFKLAPGVENDLAQIINENFSETERGKHNGGLSQRLVDAAIEALNMRLELDSGSIDTLVTLTTADFEEGAAKLRAAWWH